MEQKAKETANLSIESAFETLDHLPISLQYPQCVAHKNEILICGGYQHNKCYSYHTIKKQYKFICSYPEHGQSNRSCVVKWAKSSNANANEITLLSFDEIDNNILVMKYVSVWNIENGDDNIRVMTEKRVNEWIPLVDNNNKPISFGVFHVDHRGTRAIIAGSNNHLLFITYNPNKISVFNLNICKTIRRANLPTDENSIIYHCFVSKTVNTNASKRMHEMVLFCDRTGLSILYDEDANEFTFNNIRVCATLRSLLSYGYVCVNNYILFFGGCNINDNNTSNGIYKYSIMENKWMKFEDNLPISLCDCSCVLNEDNTFINILGGYDGKEPLSQHIRTNVNKWMQADAAIDKLWLVDEEEKRMLEEIQMDLENIDEDFDIQKWKVIDFELFVIKKRKKAIDVVIAHWVHSSSIKLGWINDFTVIVSKYILRKYFKPSRIFQDYTSELYSVRFSPDGKKIVSNDRSGRILMWDTKLGKQIGELEGHSDMVYDAQFSPDGTMLVSCSGDNTIRLWNLVSYDKIRTLEGHSDSVTTAEFSPDGKIIASGSCDQTIRLWDVNSGRELQRIEYHSDWVNDVEFSPDGNTIVSSSSDCTIGIWDVKTGKNIAILSRHSRYVMTAQFSPDGCFIASCSGDCTIRIWDVMSGTEVKKLIGHSKELVAARYFPDGQSLVSSSFDDTIRLWDIQSEIDIQILRKYPNSVRGMDHKMGQSDCGQQYESMWTKHNCLENHVLSFYLVSQKFKQTKRFDALFPEVFQIWYYLNYENKLVY
ncbi:WD-40 repeat protein [Reticulomyxa filosa]|uniref:WD-40 repeat protein n=1 Tax=Reticulomyxa filosa TaxID=46433 RepID=X6NQH0_RETFI|nr:WD-40 repeat protein [Reticulomyxa filosa]|eukprot:ETO28266.1 WD-40 repeat protein [Reticulomyxa filosa]